MAGPLADLRILDLTEYIAGPYATKLLADFGADVIKVESPAGDISRTLGPFPGDTPHPEKSGTFFFFNTNKRSVVLDLEKAAGRLEFLRLLASVDAVVESFQPGTMDRLGIGWETIHALRPDLPLISITNFGQTGPYRDYKGTELTLYAYAGELYSMGIRERAPVTMYGTASLVESGSAAALAILAAIRVSHDQGIGQHVDFAISDSHFGGADRRHVPAIAFEFSGRRTPRPPMGTRPILSGVYPCADGYMEFSAAGTRWDRFQTMLDYPEWATDAKWQSPGALMNPELKDEFEGHFFPWLFEHTKRDIWAKAREARVLCGPLFSVDELSEDPHFRSRGFWECIPHPVLGEVETPGRPFILPLCPWEIRRPAPLLGQHTEEVLAESSPPRSNTATPAAPKRLPLEGVRIIDLCVVWAGPFSTMLLGDLGAEVIKVENPFMMQPMTRGTIARPSKELLARFPPAVGGYPNNEPGPRPWNYNPTFVSMFRNKKSVTMDLRTPEGLELFGRLVATADAVVENNATETMEKLGITYDWLRKQKEDIIMMRIPAYGSAGEYAQARALGVHLESVMGHTLLRGYPDLDPSNNTPIFSGDYLAGSQTALAVMMALHHRDKTGEGQKIEMAQAENASGMLAQAFMEYSLNGRVPERRGNRSLYDFAPWGIYATMGGSAEEALDHWLAISVSSDHEWQSLVREMGNPAWAQDPALATNAGRLACHDLIDTHIEEWTAGFEDYDLFHRLQAAGVPSAPVIEGSRAFDDPHVQARANYQAQTLYDGIGPYRYTTPFFKFPETPITVRQPPVALGEHNDYVYRDVIGVTEEEYDHYKALGYVSMDFDPSIP